jgi:hypothetical protein
MKRLSIVVILAVSISMAALGCRSVAVTKEFQNYKSIYISWLDLGEKNYAAYGYPTKGEWANELREQNVNGLQKYTRDYMKGWDVTGANSPKAAAPQKNPQLVVVKFTNVMFNQALFSIRCGMDFYDGATGKLLKHATVDSSTISYSPWGYANRSFSGRLSNAMYNLAYNIQYYMTN